MASRRTKRMADDCEKPKSAKGGGHACAAFNCTNSQYKHDCRGKSFYRFPRDTERCDAWLQNLKRGDLLSKETGRTYAELNKNYRLCGDHFEDSQFTTEEKKRLVWNAVPTLFNPVPKRPRPAIVKLPLTKERSEPTTKEFKLAAKRKHSALPHPSTPATTVNNKRTVATFSSVDGPASSANSAEKTRPPSQRGPLMLLTIKSEPEDEEHSAQDTTELEVKFEPGEDRATGSSCHGERPPMPLVKIEADWEDDVAPPSLPHGTAPLVPQVKVEAEEEEEVTDASSAEEQTPGDDCEIFTNVKKSSSTTTPMCLGTGNAPYTDIVYPAPAPPSAEVSFEFEESSFSLPMPVHQEHPPPVPSTEGSSTCTFSIPDPLNADGVQVTIDHGEEREGPVTEDMQTMGSLASPAPPLHSSSMKKRRAENKKMGISKRARQLDYNAENTVITEYYKILIEKEKRALEREAEKHKREKEALERAAERDRQATKFFAIGTAVAELVKQKLETELNQ